jgi:hypothetical protein
LLHRAVKPGNILFEAQGRTLLGDLGIVQAVGNPPGGPSATGEKLGSPDYMAPEIHSGKFHPASDQYALAAVVYQALGGRLPRQGLRGAEAAGAGLEPLAGRIPRRAAQAVMRALSPEPRERFGSCQDFARAFEKGLQRPAEKPPLRAGRAAAPALEEPAKATWKQERGTLLDALLVALVLATGLAGAWLTHAASGDTAGEPALPAETLEAPDPGPRSAEPTPEPPVVLLPVEPLQAEPPEAPAPRPPPEASTPEAPEPEPGARNRDRLQPEAEPRTPAVEEILLEPEEDVPMAAAAEPPAPAPEARLEPVLSIPQARLEPVSSNAEARLEPAATIPEARLGPAAPIAEARLEPAATIPEARLGPAAPIGEAATEPAVPEPVAIAAVAARDPPAPVPAKHLVEGSAGPSAAASEPPPAPLPEAAATVQPVPAVALPQEAGTAASLPTVPLPEATAPVRPVPAAPRREATPTVPPVPAVVSAALLTRARELARAGEVARAAELFRQAVSSRPGAYTVQLDAAADPQAVRAAFGRVQSGTELLVLPNRQRYFVCLGIYVSHDDAAEASEALPAALRGGSRPVVQRLRRLLDASQ